MHIVVRLATHADTDIIADYNAAMAKETEEIGLNREVCKKAPKHYSKIHKGCLLSCRD
jgi:hypothetical protein